MTVNEIIRYLAIWSLAGALAFTLFVFLSFRSGIVFAARQSDGTLKERIPLAGLLAMGAFLLLLVAFFLAANRLGLGDHIFGAPFGQLFLLNLVLYLILFAFDTLIIDAVVLGAWRPSFLRLPLEMGSSSMTQHIRRSLPVGFVSGILLALITSTISYLVWARP
jgi:hypothetical protein